MGFKLIAEQDIVILSIDQTVEGVTGDEDLLRS
jgi:hypothetical protein